MTLAEAVETTGLHRVAGLTGDRTTLVMTRPFRAPHQAISDVGLIGGGQVPMPGEVSLAHNGMRFLDELTLLGQSPMGTQAAWQPTWAGQGDRAQTRGTAHAHGRGNGRGD